MPPSKTGPNKPRGKKSAYAYFIQICRGEQKRNRPNETVVYSDFAKLCSTRWKDMSTHQKAPFQALADKDKKRFENEMKNYMPPKIGQDPDPEKKTSKNTKKGKDKRKEKYPNAPKRLLTVLFWFTNTERPRVSAMLGNVKGSEVVKEMGRMWREMDSSDARRTYVTIAERDRARYEKDMEQYKKEQQLKENNLLQVPPQANNDVYAYAGEAEEDFENSGHSYSSMY